MFPLLPIFSKLQASIRLETDRPVKDVRVRQKGDRVIIEVEEEDKNPNEALVDSR